MAIIQFILSIIIIGNIYKKMRKSEKDEQISKSQAIVPIILGIVSVFISFFFVLGNGFILLKLGIITNKLPVFPHSLISAFVGAGLPEEISKLIMMCITILIFKPKIKNVYEYILIGAGVGFGFTLLEEFLYGSGSVVITILRLSTLASHMMFGIIMATHLGKAKYNKVTGNGSVSIEYLKAILIPITIHTLYDMCTANNHFLRSEDNSIAVLGVIIGIVGLIVIFITQFVIFKKLKKNTDNYCELKLIDDKIS